MALEPATTTSGVRQLGRATSDDILRPRIDTEEELDTPGQVRRPSEPATWPLSTGRCSQPHAGARPKGSPHPSRQAHDSFARRYTAEAAGEAGIACAPSPDAAPGPCPAPSLASDVEDVLLTHLYGWGQKMVQLQPKVGPATARPPTRCGQLYAETAAGLGRCQLQPTGPPQIQGQPHGAPWPPTLLPCPCPDPALCP